MIFDLDLFCDIYRQRERPYPLSDIINIILHEHEGCSRPGMHLPESPELMR